MHKTEHPNVQVLVLVSFFTKDIFLKKLHVILFRFIFAQLLYKLVFIKGTQPFCAQQQTIGGLSISNLYRAGRILWWDNCMLIMCLKCHKRGKQSIKKTEKNVIFTDSCSKIQFLHSFNLFCKGMRLHLCLS